MDMWRFFLVTLVMMYLVNRYDSCSLLINRGNLTFRVSSLRSKILLISRHRILFAGAHLKGSPRDMARLLAKKSMLCKITYGKSGVPDLSIFETLTALLIETIVARAKKSAKETMLL